jgi:hypothetical protein
MLLQAIAFRSMHANPDKKSSKAATVTRTGALELSTIDDCPEEANIR